MTRDQIESARVARLQLLDLGDSKTAALLDWAVTAEPIPEAIESVIRHLHTQDNRITESPLFAVQERRDVSGVDEDYERDHAWVNDDCIEISDQARVAALDAAYEAGDETPGARRIGIIPRWEFVTGCLTEHGCREYIARNGHNLNEPRIYAYGSYRNSEWQALRRWLMSLIPAPTTAAKEA